MTNLNQKLKNKIIEILKKDERIWNEEKTELNQTLLLDLTEKIDEKVIDLLLQEKDLRDKFFVKIKDVYVFKTNEFRFFMEENKVYNSYTQYKNQIGLTDGKRFLKDTEDLVLNWPFKDCVLEGGMTKEDEKNRNEIFFNEILAKDEIDRLTDEKTLVNWKKYTAKGEEKVKEFNKDEKTGTIKDNLIIKGNNLLALHSLKKEFAGKVKLIYIDPPYNPENQNNTFTYNNNFNHSTWLTFMKNRLEIAKILLKEDGILEIAIDKNEHAYLGVLLDEIFPEHDKHFVTIVHNPRGVQGDNFSYVHEYTYFVIPQKRKTLGNRKIEEEDVDWRNLRDNGGESLRTDAKNCFYPVIIENGEIIGFGKIPKDDFHPKKQVEEKDGRYYIWPIDKSGIERKWRYALQSVERIKDLLRVKESKNSMEIELGKNFGMYRTVWIDKKYDANENGTKLVKKLVPDCKFSFPKSLYNVYDCIYAAVSEDKDAIILDYHAGSGTTAHAVLNLNKDDGGNRRFILIEQMDYIESCTCKRVQKVLEIDKLKDSFIYCELAKYNEIAKEKILACKNLKELEKLFDELYEKYFLNYNLKIKQFKEKTLKEEGFKSLSLNEQKKLFLEMLDLNQMYVNKTEMADKKFNISKEDQKLTFDFYSEEN